MVFSSPTFLFVFLPVTLLGYLLVPARLRNPWLLLASGLFYLWGAGDQIGIILFVALVSFAGARLVVRSGRSKPAVLAAVLIVLVLPLFTVKYLPQLLSWSRELGISGAPTLPYVLPLGISFFTFHALSYVIDLARGRIPPWTSLLNYLVYLFLFPHQIAGPIVRYGEIRDEVETRRDVTAGRAAYGATRFAWGLAKKACVADPCGLIADAVFAQAGAVLTMPMAWLGVFAYAVQIYFDFSAYSDMAIGLAALFGFHFPENFNAPYSSASVTEFWRRWHVTLSRWFRDSVYIPLGGSRQGPGREYAALLLTFLATSLWHGASAPFLVWGGLHSAALVVERVTGLRNCTTWTGLRRVLTALFVVLAWVPFRSLTMGDALAVWRAMFAGELGGLTPTVLVLVGPIPLLALVIGLASFAGPRGGPWFRYTFGAEGGLLATRRIAAAALATPVLLGVAVVALLWLDFSPFIYFQF